LQGHFYDVEELDRLVTQKNKETGWELGIHVDAASGGFVAPFAFPDMKW
jgi:glutamate decarboxylase